MKRLTFLHFCIITVLLCSFLQTFAQQRRPIDSRHPMWMIHVDVWNKADPQKIIDLIPDDIKPYVCINLSLSCQYNTERNQYLMPQNAVRTYKSWGTVCQQNGLWFSCQPASGGHTHLQTDDLETFEYFFKRFPNFLGWNYAEQFWGFDEAGNKSSASQTDQIALFAELVKMSHKYGGFLTVSFCGNKWSHGLSPVGMMKRNKQLLQACRDYPEAILWLYKYTQSWCFYNSESVTLSPFISGLATNYGVRYDNCAWDGVRQQLGDGSPYPVAAGIGTVMEQTGMNGGAVWDGPELIWTEDFRNLSNSTVDGYTRRNWGTFDGFRGAWIDMWRKVTDGTLYIPTREEVVGKTKIVVIADRTSGSDEEKYATWGDIYDGLYKQTDRANTGDGQFMNNRCFFKKTGRYGAIPLCVELYDSLAKTIPLKVKRSNYTSRWSTQTKKVNDFNARYPELSKGDLYVNRFKNQLVTYWPHTNLHGGKLCTGEIPLEYNTCDKLKLTLGTLGSALVREYADHIDFYFNNFRTDTTALVTETIVVTGVKTEPTYKLTKRTLAKGNATADWNAETGTYTLTLKHMGGLDLTINCEGNASDRRTDMVSTTSLTADLPKQPDPYHGEIIIEAEDMDYKNIKSCVTDPYTWYPSVIGHAGNGFADMGTNTSGALRHQLTLSKAGSYRISMRYTCTSKAGKVRAQVNGKTVMMTTEKTELNEWKKATVEATLKAGKNDLVLTNHTGLPMYIDQIIYTPADLENERFLITVRKASHGSVSSDVSEAMEGDTVTLKVNESKGYVLKELRMVNGVNYTLGTTLNIVAYDKENQTVSFLMPDDIVTIVPVFGEEEENGSLYKLSFASVAEGSLPQGWRCVQENGEVHEYPETYSLGARTFAGFTGYQGKGLYWRDNYAEYGRQSAYPLKLAKGNYTLTYVMAAWKKNPNYKAQILDNSGNMVAESVSHDATPNADGSRTANLTQSKTHELPFCIETEGNYIIRFENTSTFESDYHEFLLLDCYISETGDANSIELSSFKVRDSTYSIYNIGGERRQSLQRGINIIRTKDGQTRKVIIKD
ncbi:MAG: glycosyl hydrolase family 98 [Bacteroidaceae bacterium]|nr:glycosyl hydrolase family 98 [Bacteroidaceae bacterium]